MVNYAFEACLSRSAGWNVHALLHTCYEPQQPYVSLMGSQPVQPYAHVSKSEIPSWTCRYVQTGDGHVRVFEPGETMCQVGLVTLASWSDQWSTPLHVTPGNPALLMINIGWEPG